MKPSLALVLSLCLAAALAPGLAAQAPALKVLRGDENYPPYEMRVEGKLGGLHVELVEAVATRLGLGIEWKDVPWARALKLAETGEADAITYIGQNPEREAWAIFEPGNLLSSTKIVFLVHKANAERLKFSGRLKDYLQGRTILAVQGYAYGSPEIDGAKKEETNTMQQLVSMIALRRSEVGVISASDFFAAYRDRPEFRELAMLDPPIVECRNFIAFSRARRLGDTARKFAAAITEFKATREWAALCAKYGVQP